jgi:hypothetical protein
VTAQKYSIGELLAWVYALFRIIVRRLAKTKYLIFQASPKIMTLIRLIQRASILAGMTFAILPVYGNPAQADTPQFCVVASNGKTACGTLKAVERACVTTDTGSTVCGKYQSVRGEPAQEESPRPVQGNAPRTVVSNTAFLSKGCSRSETSLKCSFLMRNKAEEKFFCLQASSALITDSSGKTYKASNVEMGGQSSSHICDGNLKLTQDVDYEATLTFDNVPMTVRKAQVLSFPFQTKTVNLRNIPFLN